MVFEPEKCMEMFDILIHYEVVMPGRVQLLVIGALGCLVLNGKLLICVKVFFPRLIIEHIRM